LDVPLRHYTMLGELSCADYCFFGLSSNKPVSEMLIYCLHLDHHNPYNNKKKSKNIPRKTKNVNIKKKEKYKGK